MKVELEMIVPPGMSIVDASVEAQRIADSVELPVSFDFNGENCKASPRRRERAA